MSNNGLSWPEEVALEWTLRYSASEADESGKRARERLQKENDDELAKAIADSMPSPGTEAEALKLIKMEIEQEFADLQNELHEMNNVTDFSVVLFALKQLRKDPKL